MSATVSAGVGPFQNPVTARTSAIDGQADVTTSSANVLSGSEFVVDVTQLTTGSGFQDDQLQSILETSTYPTSVFMQTGSVLLPGVAELRNGTTVSLSGDLKLHGVTQAVTIPARIQLDGEAITVAGTIPFRLADYGIHATGLVSVGDEGTMAFRLVMTR